MKIKKEYVILALIIIVLSVYLVMRTSDRSLYQLPELPQVAQKEINRLQITKGKTEIVINKNDNNWYIAPEGYPADTNKVKDMLNNIEKLTLTALVSESKSYHRYDLDEEQKINIKAWKGEDLKRNIDVGKAASSFRHTFVKTAGDDRVFHARGNFKDTYDLTVDTLRDKTVLAFNASDIQQIQVTNEQQSLTFTRTQEPVEVAAPGTEKEASASPPAQKTLWQTADGRPVDEPAINGLLNSVSNLRCDKFIDNREKGDFTSPQYTLQLKGAQEYSLSIFSKAEEKDTSYRAISSASDYPFSLTDSQVEGIMKDPSKFLKTPEADKKASDPPQPESKQQKE